MWWSHIKPSHLYRLPKKLQAQGGRGVNVIKKKKYSGLLNDIFKNISPFQLEKGIKHFIVHNINSIAINPIQITPTTITGLTEV